MPNKEFITFLKLSSQEAGCQSLGGGRRALRPLPPTHVHTHTHTHSRTHPHTRIHTHARCAQWPGRSSSSGSSRRSGLRSDGRAASSVQPLNAFSRSGETPPDTPLRSRADAEDAGKREEGVQGGSAGEAERRAAAAVEEEALRPDRGRSPAAAAEAARPPAAPAAAARRGGRRRRQGQGAALRQHEDRGLRGAQGQVRVLHGGHDGGEGDRLQVPAGRGLERGDHPADGPVQEPPGDPGRQVHPAEAAAAGGPDARTEDRPERPQCGVTHGDPRGHWCTISGQSDADPEDEPELHPPPPPPRRAAPSRRPPPPRRGVPRAPAPRPLSIQTLLSQETDGQKACEKTAVFQRAVGPSRIY